MKKGYFSTFQLILLVLFAALVVVAKIALKTPIKLPGHTGIFWMAILLVSAGVVRKPGAVSLVGLTSGLIAAFLGLGDFGGLNTLLSYSMAGIGTDLTLSLLGGNPENFFIAGISGAAGHLSKFLVKWILGIISGAPLGFIAFGTVYAVISYLIFGILGGILGAMTLIALRKAGFFAYLEEKR